MDKADISNYMAEVGRKGGKARLKTMTAEQRRASARKASKAAALKRKAAAAARKKAKER
jgi:hypothetical protein